MGGKFWVMVFLSLCVVCLVHEKMRENDLIWIYDLGGTLFCFVLFFPYFFLFEVNMFWDLIFFEVNGFWDLGVVFWFGVERWQCCLLALMVSLGLVNFQKESRESLLMMSFCGGSEASICFGKTQTFWYMCLVNGVK